MYRLIIAILVVMIVGLILLGYLLETERINTGDNFEPVGTDVILPEFEVIEGFDKG